ncbi:MAG: cell filamentation protein Fic [Erysipelotrichaceae bacterium]|nr:cell filamentation protein Fic [Erysipelotrichaceae bacterium]
MESKYSNHYVLTTGIGLQDVDQLKNSPYFVRESERYLKGEITLDELEEIITSYYQSKPPVIERSEEADKISIRIARLISDDSFSFTVGQLLTIHRFLFHGVLEHPGEPRGYNFSKKEWVLDGASVVYGDYRDLEMTLQYDFEQERRFNYARLSIDQTIEHLALFIANLWQIHVFEEGNTRTTAVFAIKYLRSLGFDVTNDTFAENAWYFRNALVRANYSNVPKGIYEDRSYLIKFLRNLLLGEDNALNNKDLRIVTPSSTSSSKESRVVALIKANPSVKAADIANDLGVSLRTVKSLLSALTQNGTIRRVGGRKNGHWEAK